MQRGQNVERVESPVLWSKSALLPGHCSRDNVLNNDNKGTSVRYSKQLFVWLSVPQSNGWDLFPHEFPGVALTSHSLRGCSMPPTVAVSEVKHFVYEPFL